MITKKRWIVIDHRNKDLYKTIPVTKKIFYEGLFLFGFIPLWIEQTKVEYSD